jgi:hypothetical protein
MRITWSLALALIVTMAGAPAAKPDEIFLCANGQLLYVDDTNRTCLRDHPCVRAWFEQDAGRRTAANSSSDARASSSRRSDASVRPGSQVSTSCPLGPARDLVFQTTKSGGIEFTLPVDGSLTDATPEETVAGGQQSSLQCAPAVSTVRGAGGPRTVYVREYVRKDGTRVRAHFRSPPGSGRSRR